MKILGIHSGHNASACLLQDGKLEYAIQEERLRKVKNWWGFPELSIKNFLEASNLEKLGFRRAQIRIVNHHLCHTSSAYYSILNKESQSYKYLILTLDGSGDGLTR